MNLRFSGLLLRLVDYERTMHIDAPTLGEAVAAAEQRHPQLRPVLRDAEGKLRRSHRVFINGDLTPTANLATRLGPADDVEFLTAITGG